MSLVTKIRDLISVLATDVKLLKQKDIFLENNIDQINGQLQSVSGINLLGIPNQPLITAPLNGAVATSISLDNYSHPLSVPQGGLLVQRSISGNFDDEISNYFHGSLNSAILPSISPGQLISIRAKYLDTYSNHSLWSSIQTYTEALASIIRGVVQVSSPSTVQGQTLSVSGTFPGDQLLLALALNGATPSINNFNLIGSFPNTLTGSSWFLFSKVATLENETVTLPNCFCAMLVSKSGTSFTNVLSTLSIPDNQQTSGPFNMPTNSLIIGFDRSSNTVTLPNQLDTYYPTGSINYFTPFVGYSEIENSNLTITRSAFHYALHSAIIN